MISCGMRRLYGEHALIKGSDGAHPHGKHSQRYIRRRRSARYLRQTCVFLPKSGRYTSENNSLVCISYIITSPLSKISDLFVFRASCFSSLPGDKKLASIVKYPLARLVARFVWELLNRAQSYFFPLRSAFVQSSCLRVQSHRNFDVHGSDKTAKTAWRMEKW